MYRVIVNPKAGAGRATALLPMVEEALRKRGVPFDTRQTERPWHAAELAAQAASEGVEAVVAVGGDGTLFEIANGLCETKTALYIVSCGTGNDWVRSIPLPKDPLAALDMQLNAEPVPVDAGAAGKYRFLNVAGAGFDVEVLRQTVKYKPRFRGILPYLFGVIETIRTYKPIQGVLEVDGKRVEGRFTIVSFANGQYIGGGMRVARKADPFDGLFDVIYVMALPKWRVCMLLPWFLPGLHDLFSVTHRVRAKSARFSSKGMTVNMDGELRDMDDIEFRLIPGGIRIPLPVKETLQR